MATFGRRFRTEKWSIRRACVEVALLPAVFMAAAAIWLLLALATGAL